MFSWPLLVSEPAPANVVGSPFTVAPPHENESLEIGSAMNALESIVPDALSASPAAVRPGGVGGFVLPL